MWGYISSNFSYFPFLSSSDGQALRGEKPPQNSKSLVVFALSCVFYFPRCQAHFCDSQRIFWVFFFLGLRIFIYFKISVYCGTCAVLVSLWQHNLEWENFPINFPLTGQLWNLFFATSRIFTSFCLWVMGYCSKQDLLN